MSNVVYVLGAGASAAVLPTIKERRNSKGELVMKSLANELLLFGNDIKNFNGYEKYHNLCIEAFAFSTPDTFAKFLYVTNRNEDYRAFKKILSAYFFWKERLDNSKCLDIRVISFLTTLAGQDNSFPQNVKIITWNYDSQFIRAFDEARQNTDAFLPNFKIFPFYIDDTQDKINLNLIHLNGVAGYSYHTERNSLLNKFLIPDLPETNFLQYCQQRGLDEKYRKKDAIDRFNNTAENIMISYAWENKFDKEVDYYYAEKRLETVKAMARASEILVVIGYSFPFFNRGIDKAIFNEMPTLKKIYFQDPSLDGSFLYNQFNLEKEKVDIEHISGVENYYIPHEL